MTLRAPPLSMILGLILTCLSVGCAGDAPNERAAPESAFRSLRGALADHDSEAVWSFLGPRTRAALEARAAEFVAAGLLEPSPGELLVAARVPGEADIDTIERAVERQQSVTLRITSYLGEVSEVELLRDGDGWVVELELPELVDAGSAGGMP